MSQKFFVTTPIYYSNGVPHIGHAYASIIADIIAKYHRLLGEDVKFSTWVDENSQKVVETAEEAGMSVMQYADIMASKHQAVWDGLGISYTDFIRTTESRHKQFVQEVLQKSFDNWDIYEGMYEGKYCVGCEAFKKDSDLTEDGRCNDHPNKPIQVLKEKNYFFRLSKYEQQLSDFYTNNPSWIIPENRFREVIEFVKWGLEDFSVSRETNRFGIPLPFDSTQVTYVWYDALFNYLTVCQDGDEDFWPANLHIVWKDIIRFHGIYWPAMLMSAGYSLPKQLLSTGHFTVDGQKMSKSIWNVINPVDFCQEYSRDMMVLYLLTAFPVGEDGDFSLEKAILIYNAKLANNLWNLLNRFLVLSLKIGGQVNGLEDDIVSTERVKSILSVQKLYAQHDIKEVLQQVFFFSDVLNRYIDETKPWTLKDMNDETIQKLSNILFTVGRGLETIALLLLPFFEEKMKELLGRIGLHISVEDLFNQIIQGSSQYTIAEKWEPLYTRIDKS